MNVFKPVSYHKRVTKRVASHIFDAFFLHRWIINVCKMEEESRNYYIYAGDPAMNDDQISVIKVLGVV